MVHKIIVDGGDHGVFVYQLSDDISKQLNDLAASHPLLVETLLMAIRNNFSQLVDFMNTAIRAEFNASGHLDVASVLIKGIQDNQDRLLSYLGTAF